MTTSPLLRVVGYNMTSYGKSGLDVRRGQHELLRFLRPDVVLLQEIYAQHQRGADGPAEGQLKELECLVAEIGEAIGMVGLAVPAVHSDCHLAILWRPEYKALSQRTYDLLLWHGLGVVQLDVGADVPLTAAVSHLGPWHPDRQLADATTLAGKLPLGQATILGVDWNSVGADPAYDPEPDWTLLPPGWIPRVSRWNDDPDAPLMADRRPAQLMQRSGWHDAAPTLGRPWQPTGGHQGLWYRREDVFWTNRRNALRAYWVADTPAARRLSSHLPIVAGLDRSALAAPAAVGDAPAAHGPMQAVVPGPLSPGRSELAHVHGSAPAAAPAP